MSGTSTADASPSGATFDEQDWEQIKEFLASESQPLTGISDPAVTVSSGTVVCALAALRASLDREILPAGKMTDQLLDLWALVHRAGPGTARPVESLLSSLTSRDMVSAREVTEMCDRVEAAMKAQPVVPEEPAQRCISSRPVSPGY